MTFNLGFYPSVDVIPGTVEGIRRLAVEAAELGDLSLLDTLELAIIRAQRIRPDVDDADDFEPVAVIHSDRGLVVQWETRKEVECPACVGAGDLWVNGRDGRDYKVECPRCYGGGTEEGESAPTVWTDVDGNLVPMGEACA